MPAQRAATIRHLKGADSILIKTKNPDKFNFGHFFNSDTLYAILLNTYKCADSNQTYFKLGFYEKINGKWNKKNEYDSLKSLMKLQTRFSNYSNDNIPDYLVSADIIGTGGNETEYLFIFDSKTRSIRLINDFEKLPSTSYDKKSGIIISLGLVASIPNYEYYKINDFHLQQTGGKEIWTDDKYGYMQKYRIEKDKKVIYHKEKKRLPFDLYEWK